MGLGGKSTSPSAADLWVGLVIRLDNHRWFCWAEPTSPSPPPAARQAVTSTADSGVESWSWAPGFWPGKHLNRIRAKGRGNDWSAAAFALPCRPSCPLAAWRVGNRVVGNSSVPLVVEHCFLHARCRTRRNVFLNNFTWIICIFLYKFN